MSSFEVENILQLIEEDATTSSQKTSIPMGIPQKNIHYPQAWLISILFIVNTVPTAGRL